MFKIASIPFFLFVLIFGYFYPEAESSQRYWDITWFLFHDSMMVFLLYVILDSKFPVDSGERHSVWLLFFWFIIQMGYVVGKYWGFHVDPFAWAIISTAFFTLNTVYVFKAKILKTLKKWISSSRVGP